MIVSLVEHLIVLLTEPCLHWGVLFGSFQSYRDLLLAVLPTV